MWPYNLISLRRCIIILSYLIKNIHILFLDILHPISTFTNICYINYFREHPVSNTGSHSTYWSYLYLCILVWRWSKERPKHAAIIKYQHHILTCLLTPWSRVLLEKLTGSAASQEIPRIFGTRRILTVITSARHLSLSWANSIQSPQTHPTYWRSILILSSHLRLGLPNGLFPSGFPTRTLCTPLPSSIRATCPAHLILLDFTTRAILGKEYRSLRSSLTSYTTVVLLTE